MPLKLWRTALIQTADEQLARTSVARLVADPYRPVFDPIRLRWAVHPELPGTFLSCVDDQTCRPACGTRG
jgi:hypothetical protein